MRGSYLTYCWRHTLNLILRSPSLVYKQSCTFLALISYAPLQLKFQGATPELPKKVGAAPIWKSSVRPVKTTPPPNITNARI